MDDAWTVPVCVIAGAGTKTAVKICEVGLLPIGNQENRRYRNN